MLELELNDLKNWKNQAQALPYLSELCLELEWNGVIVVEFLDKLTRLETFVFGKLL